MRTRTGPYVLDANAVLHFATAGVGAPRVREVLRDAALQERVVLISVLNWGEVFYILWRKRGEEKARQTMESLSHLPVEIVPLGLSQTYKAGEIKVLHGIPYVDCVAAALAIEHKATLVTSDRDFEKLGRNFPVLWIDRS